MLYIYIGQHVIKALHVNKSLLGQYSVQQAEKKFSVQLLKAGKVAHTDIVASAIKEVVSHLTGGAAKEKQISLILPQEAFYFSRSEVPNDMAAPAIASFMKEKARSILPAHLDSVYYDFVGAENEAKRIVSLYAIEESTVQAYKDTLQLVEMQLVALLPDTLSYYKLFEKTLRRGKIEHILYGSYEEDLISAYLFDSFGLLEKESFSAKLTAGKGVEEPLKKIGAEYEEKHLKINRLILSGTLSDSVRQDTFTKDVGIWTNPLKRILPHFYADYLKMLVPIDNNPFPILQFDICFGALIFSIENRGFSLLKNTFSPSLAVMGKSVQKKNFNMPSIRISKEIMLFIVSFAGSFLIFTLLTQSPAGFNMRIPSFIAKAKPTPVPTAIPLPTATPTPAIKKDTIKVKILNGSGTPGKAGDVKTVMKEKGYQDIVTGNADAFDFELTEIAVKKGNEHLGSLVKSELADYAKNANVTVLADKEEADVVVTVGKDFK
ncbi:MAG: LytR C-terminal domain-containing protein [Candidatus Roizmanbacteria bacterium]|nr:LytR C-terminal domain-containing protein [Candidatus Roizmanbacteria bacterium]